MPPLPPMPPMWPPQQGRMRTIAGDCDRFTVVGDGVVPKDGVCFSQAGVVQGRVVFI